MKNGKDIQLKRGSCPNCPPKKYEIRNQSDKGKINVSYRNENR